MRRVALLLALSILASDRARARAEGPLSPFPKGYLSHAELGRRLQQIASEHPGRVAVGTLSKSREGRDVWVASVGDPEGRSDRPAVLIVANLEADHIVGSQVALGLIERLAKAPADAGWLSRTTVHIVPRLDVDGAERTLSAASPPVRGNALALDRDRDARRDEDGPEDLDGDGAITAMWVRDRRASLIPEDDPRQLRAAKPEEGEAGRFSLYVEGVDSDGDGRLNEDPAAGVRLDRNWPHRWPEFQPEAGRAPVSEPETRGLIEFIRAHPEIAVVWTFSLHDTIREEPKKPGSTLDDADLPLVRELSGLYRKAMDAVPKDRPLLPAAEKKPALPDLGEPSALVEPPSRFLEPPGLTGSLEGSLSEWAYQQWGVLGFASRVWDGPRWAEPEKEKDEKKDDKEKAKDEPKPPSDGEARWLFWNDRVLGGAGFTPLSAFDHPSLGRVLIGGWKTGVRLNPPVESIEPLTAAHETFLAAILERLPKLTIASATAKPLDGGVFEVEVLLRNEGTMPTSLAQGERTRVAEPLLVRLGPENVQVVGGRRLERADRLAGAGGNRAFRWIVVVPEGVNALTVEAGSPRAGRVRREIPLR